MQGGGARRAVGASGEGEDAEFGVDGPVGDILEDESDVGKDEAEGVVVRRDAEFEEGEGAGGVGLWCCGGVGEAGGGMLIIW